MSIFRKEKFYIYIYIYLYLYLYYFILRKENRIQSLVFYFLDILYKYIRIYKLRFSYL